MFLFQRVARHGVAETIRLLPKNLCHLARTLSPQGIAARHRDRDFDRRHGTKTSGIIPLGALDLSGQGAAHATMYEPVSPACFAVMMQVVPNELADFRFIDYGSGRGRALLLASHYPFKEIIGIELSQRLHRDAAVNLQKYCPPERVCFNTRLLLQDVAQFVPPPGPIVAHFFNPFDRELMAIALRRLEEVQRSQRSPVYILYGYPEQEDLLSSSAFWVKLDGSNGPDYGWAVFSRQAGS